MAETEQRVGLGGRQRWAVLPLVTLVLLAAIGVVDYFVFRYAMVQTPGCFTGWCVVEDVAEASYLIVIAGALGSWALLWCVPPRSRYRHWRRRIAIGSLAIGSAPIWLFLLWWPGLV